MTDFESEQAPREVRNFLFRYVDSVELVRVLLLLHDSPERKWSVDQISAELRSSPVAIRKRLDDLYERKVLRKGPDSETHGYEPQNLEIRRSVSELSKYEKRYPYRVIDLIYARGEDAVREFANAFTFKKDKAEDK